jgi:hypothetical protein
MITITNYDNKIIENRIDNISNQLKDYLTLKNMIVAVLVFALSKVYWFISTHINFQTKKHIGYEFLGGKRKGSTHHKKH